MFNEDSGNIVTVANSGIAGRSFWVGADGHGPVSCASERQLSAIGVLQMLGSALRYVARYSARAVNALTSDPAVLSTRYVLRRATVNGNAARVLGASI